MKVVRRKYNQSFSNKFTCEMGDLVPFLCKPVMPGSSKMGSAVVNIDFMAQLNPVFHNVYCHFYYFFVPYRLVWENFDKFRSLKNLFDNSEEHSEPYAVFNNVQPGSLADYLGVRTGVNADIKTEVLRFRAYFLIWNKWFRSQHYQEEIEILFTDGLDESTYLNTLKKINWEKDFFTSTTPSPQLGDPVNIPIGDEAPVIGNGTTLGFTTDNENCGSLWSVGNAYADFGGGAGQPIGTQASAYSDIPYNKYVGITKNKDKSGLIADLSDVSGIPIGEIEKAWAMSAFLRRLNIAGGEYKDFLNGVFGVRPRDSRLQWPEYIGGGKVPVIFTDVVQTSESGSTPQGHRTGQAFLTGSSNMFRKFFEEDGLLMGLMAVRPESAYYQGMAKEWEANKTQYDYPNPYFSDLEDVPVHKSELYVQGSDADKDIIGYQKPYQNYKTYNNEIHGEFRTTLDTYHMARKFSEAPEINGTFVTCNPTDRIWATESGEGTAHLRVRVDNLIVGKEPLFLKGKNIFKR